MAAPLCSCQTMMNLTKTATYRGQLRYISIRNSLLANANSKNQSRLSDQSSNKKKDRDSTSKRSSPPTFASGSDFRKFNLKKPGSKFDRKWVVWADALTSPPRAGHMPQDIDWTSVWPTQKTFNYSVFCTPWPEELKSEASMKEHFHLEVISSDFCFAGPSVRDPRARVVTFKVPNEATELRLFEICVDHPIFRIMENGRLGVRKRGRRLCDIHLGSQCEQGKHCQPAEYIQGTGSDGKGKQFSNLPEDLTADNITSLEEVKTYKDAVEDIFNVGENPETLEKYRQSVLKLLKIKPGQPSVKSSTSSSLS
ncbi:RT35-like protein [Mya arenaria]|uniref:RT35-like protein n=1 Tax=Mya arenaria TaxID=6604 RepID=A0ABY7EJG7_MYAAR|nr:RT35-like protein [Mya arenaria]